MPAVGDRRRPIAASIKGKRPPPRISPKRKPKRRVVGPNPDTRDLSTRSKLQRQRDAAAAAKVIQEARIRVLRKDPNRTGKAALKRELEGKGELAKLSQALAGRAKRNTSAPTQFAREHQAGVLDDTIASRTVEDLVNAPAAVIPSLYIPSAAAFEAVRGDTSRGRQFLKDLDEQDPVLNAVVAVGNLAGDIEGAKKRWARTKELAAEHPGFTALEVAGLKGVVGRGGGTAVRTGAKVTGSERLKSAGSTERGEKTVPGTRLREKTTHSKDIRRKRRERRQDESRRREAQNLRDQADELEDPSEAGKLRAKAREKDPDLLSDRDIQRQVDEHQDVSEQLRRRHRAEILKIERDTLKKVKDAGPVSRLLVERIVKPELKDLKGYLSELKAAHQSLLEATNAGKSGAKAKLRANRQMQHDLQKAIDRIESGKVDLKEVSRLADEYAVRSRESQAKLVERGMIDAEQAERAALTPLAVRKGGGHRDKALLEERAGTARTRATRARAKAKKARGKHARLSIEHEALLKLEEAKLSAAHPLTKKAIEQEITAARTGRQKAIKKAETKKAKAKTRSESRHLERDEAERLAREDPLLTPEKEVFTTDAMRALLEGREAPGWLSQRPSTRGARNYYVASHQPPRAHTPPRRSGAATREGTFDPDAEVLVEGRARAEGLAQAFDHFQSFIDRFGARDPKRNELIREKSKREIDKHVADLNSKGDIQWKAVRINPFGAGKRQAEAMIEGTKPGEDIFTQLDEALSGSDGPGDWAIIPDTAAQRLQEHVRVLNPGNAGRAARQIGKAFRGAVLALSPTWMLGNVTEASGRTALNRVGPASYVTGRRALKKLEEVAGKEKADEVKVRTIGGGHFGGLRGQEVFNNIDAYNKGVVREIARVMGAGARLPVAKQALRGWQVYQHLVFDIVNKSIEQQFQTAMFGKQLRERGHKGAGRLVPEKLMSDKMRSLTDQAAREAAEGAVKDDTAIQIGREIDKMYGQYSKFSPDLRKAIAYWTPFVPWYLNALNFLKDLPRDHPAFTAASASAIAATNEWREDQGLGLYLDAVTPYWLQGTITTEGGTQTRAPFRYTPFSVGGDPLGTAAQQLLPQYSAIYMAMRGKDWKGKDIPDINPTKQVGVAARSFAEATIPGLSLGIRVGKKGPYGALVEPALGIVPKSSGGGGSSSSSSSSSSRLGGNRLSGTRTGSSNRLRATRSGSTNRLR